MSLPVIIGLSICCMITSSSVTKCDVRASLGDRMESTEKEINGLEEDEDIGEVLERNAAYGNLIARCDDAKRALLRPLDKKERGRRLLNNI